MRIIYNFRILTLCACLLPTGMLGRADAAQLGNIKADRILFLGNSITSCMPHIWGLAASKEAKDYAHLLASAIDARTGGKLAMVLMDRKVVDGELQPGTANVLNIAHIFERNYPTYAASKLQYQIDAKPDIVIVEIGENIPMETFKPDVFKSSLQRLVGDLKKSSNPHIFMTGYILGANATVDEIKRSVCVEDPTHRVFVDMSHVGKDASNMGDFGHPGDKGMAVIADTLFKAILAHSGAESSVK